MQQEQLEQVLIFHLENLSTTDDVLTPDTITGDYLRPSARNKKELDKVFEAVVGWTLNEAGVEEKTWPENWKSLTVRDLASKLLMLIFILMIPLLGFSQ